MASKMEVLSITKKFKFNMKKEKTECMVIRNNKEVIEDFDLKVNWKQIGRTEGYKYLGDIHDEKGDNISKIRGKEEKIEIVIEDTIEHSKEKDIGHASTRV